MAVRPEKYLIVIKIQGQLRILQILCITLSFVCTNAAFFPLKSSSSAPVWDSSPALPDTCSSQCPDRVARGSHDRPSPINKTLCLFTRGQWTRPRDHPEAQCHAKVSQQTAISRAKSMLHSVHSCVFFFYLCMCVFLFLYLFIFLFERVCLSVFLIYLFILFERVCLTLCAAPNVCQRSGGSKVGYVFSPQFIETYYGRVF